jgi:beta-glucosidase
MRISRLFAYGLVAIVTASSVGQQKAKYLDSGAKVEDRIDDLLRRMTIEEKVSQIVDSWGSTGIQRLGVPALLKTEGLHSQSYSTGATLFPQPISMAATFDPELIQKVGQQTAIEAKAAHLRASWSPVLDVVRDVRWGRTEETYGESPYLVSRMGVAWIEGFQGEGMVAIPKHFAGHGQPMGGRDSQDIGLSDRTMREIHLPSFRAAVEEAHAGGVMAAYGLWDGVPDNASITLLQKILRQEWGFDGMVVSDCGAPEHFLTKHAVVQTQEEGVALAAVAGVNMECGSLYKAAMTKAVKDGFVTEEQLDTVVRPTLRTKFRLGLFENPTSAKMIWDKLPEYDTAQSRELARKVEIEGAVLLQNDSHVLPLSKDMKTIAVIGPNADLAQTGDYSPKLAPNQLTTILQGIRSHVGATTQVLYAPGLANPLSTDTSKFGEAVAIAKQADVVVLAVGDNSHPGGGEQTTGENRDGATLDFPGAQRELIKAVAAAGTPVVLVIVNGKPFTLGWESSHIPSILVTWYPGEEGGDATADLLFGVQNPSGRLPVTWPRTPGQLPLNYDYHPSGRSYSYYDLPFTPQYRFGYGLSYTKFQYSNLRIKPKDGDPGFVSVSADVRNIGDRGGDEVAQLYITDEVASVSTPVIELEGMKRISLQAGEGGRVTFDVTPYQLSLLDANMVRRVEPGKFRIHVGGVSPDVPKDINQDRKARIGFSDPINGISGEFTEPKAYAAHFAYKLDAPGKASSGQPFAVTVTVKNDGDLTDVTEAKLYDSVELASWRFELKPGEEKSHTFEVLVYKPGDMALVAGSQIITKPISVDASPAHLAFENLQFDIDRDADLQLTAEARNVGGFPYQGELALKVDGQVSTDSQSLSLQSGEKRRVVLSHHFAIGGLHRVQIGDVPERVIVIPGGINLALRNPLVDLMLNEGSGMGTRNEDTGKIFSFRGTPQWVSGRSGEGLQMSSSASIDAGGLQLYRRSFTLSAWIRIDALGDKDELGLFGGQAPMGADQDNTGTILDAGIRNKKLFLGFHGRDIIGNKDVPQNTWVNVTYAYDAGLQKSFLYLNGSLDKTGNQASYTGPLESIGDAATLQHGRYTMDDVVVTQDCLSPELVRLLFQNGYDALQHGSYTSAWRPYADSVQSLEAVTELPAGSKLSLTVETGDKAGKVLNSQTIELGPGKHVYSLTSAKAGDQIRFRAQVAASIDGQSPVLRAVSLIGANRTERWSTPSEWGVGTAENSVAVNDSTPQGVERLQ